MPDRDPALPHVVPWLQRGFVRYCGRYVRKHFHAVRLSKTSSLVPSDGQSILFVLNHPSWWDVIIGTVLSRDFPGYRHYAPIDAEMLKKYRFFARIGMFGIEPTARGAAIFLRTARAIFAEPGGAIWVTAQGRFSDPRERPIELRPGVGAVACRMESGLVVPVAVEYPFWSERTPEALLRIGEPLSVQDGPRGDSRAWTERIERALTSTMDVLAREAIGREASAFTTISSGKVGVGGPYDWWRRMKGIVSGRRVSLGHGPDEGKPA